MKHSPVKRLVIVIVLLLVAVGLGGAIYARWQGMSSGPAGGSERGPMPVEVAPVETGTIVQRRTFSGTLEAPARFVVSPKVAGRVEQLHVDLSDIVEQGQLVAELDNEEYIQAVNVAEAELAVARANRTEAANALEIADRELQRVQTLRERGVASDSQLDSARADQLAAESRLEVARAEVTRAEAALQTARIRLGYTRVTADWTGTDEQRVVARRHVNSGDTIAANAPLLAIVELDPIMGVIYITEKDYAKLAPQQAVTLVTDAYPGRTFRGRIARLAPVFEESSRQARVELTIPNEERLLKPGMFIRATVELQRAEGAMVVPARAVTRRDDRDGVFVVDERSMAARWRPVEVGIREGERVQLVGEAPSGRVITLGQQMVDDGTPITIPDEGVSEAGASAVGGPGGMGGG